MTRFRPLAWMSPEEREAALREEHGDEFVDRKLRRQSSKGVQRKEIGDSIGSVNIRHSMLVRLHAIRDFMSVNGPRISIRVALERIIEYWEKGNM